MASTAPLAKGSSSVIQIAAWVSSKSGDGSLIDLAPLGVGRLCQVDSRWDTNEPFQRTEQRMAFTFLGGWLCFRRSGFSDAAKHELTRSHIDLRTLVARAQ